MVERHKPHAPLLYWAKEREAIRKKKLAGEPPPWTEDPILGTYRFCNVLRRDDRVSQWVCREVLSHQGDFDNLGVFLKWVALCRWVNWPPTLGGIIASDPEFWHLKRELVTYDSIDLPGIGAYIDAVCASDQKAWTGAYMVRAPSKNGYPGYTKGRFVAEVVVGCLDARMDSIKKELSNNTCQGVWQALYSAPNWGSFMAGQVVADLTYTPLLGKAHDLYTWAPQGPGSKRGFNRLLGRPLKAKVPDEDWARYLPEWRRMLVEELGLPQMTLHDVQNCLCEVDKYLRAQSGEGRPRSVYKSETAY